MEPGAYAVVSSKLSTMLVFNGQRRFFSMFPHPAAIDTVQHIDILELDIH